MKKIASVFAGLFMLVCVNLSAEGKSDVINALGTEQSTVIEDAFRVVTLSELNASSPADEITKAVKANGASETVANVVISTINGLVQNKDVQVRSKVYDQLNAVEYSKLNFLTKALVNEYFNKKKDPNAELNAKLKTLRDKMVSAK